MLKFFIWPNKVELEKNTHKVICPHQQGMIRIETKQALKKTLCAHLLKRSIFIILSTSTEEKLHYKVNFFLSI